VTAPLLRLEWRIARAAVRRAVRHPTRRLLWMGVVAVALAAAGTDVATSSNAARTLGAWSPSPMLVVAAGCAVVGVAWLAGRYTTLTYGTRAADAIWWRYAGVPTREAERATTVLLAVRTTVIVATVAAPLGALFASADSERAGIIAFMALAAIAVAPLAVLASSAAAGSREVDGVSDERARWSGPPRGPVPRGIAAARWLIAARRGEPTVPWIHFLGGVVLGTVLPFVAARVGGQTIALAVVIGGFALVLDGALRRTTAPGTLLTPWWRAAVGTSGRSIAAWAIADAASVAAFAAGAMLALGAMLRTPLLGIAALPLVVCAPVALRTTVLATDTLFPGDRRGPGAFVRVLVVGALTALVAVASFAAGARAGAPASLAVATAMLLGIVAMSALFASRRLSAAT